MEQEAEARLEDLKHRTRDLEAAIIEAEEWFCNDTVKQKVHYDKETVTKFGESLYRRPGTQFINSFLGRPSYKRIPKEWRKNETWEKFASLLEKHSDHMANYPLQKFEFPKASLEAMQK